MKLKVTVNLGNYQNMTIESSEHDHIRNCIIDVLDALQQVGDPRTDDYAMKYLSGGGMGSL